MNMLPAGISTDLEIFKDEQGNLCAMNCGVKSLYLDLAPELRAIFQEELRMDHVSQQILINHFKLSKPTEMEVQFVDCRYCGYDTNPDLQDGKTSPDAPQCNQIRTCPGFNAMCVSPADLTRKEYEVVRLIARGKQNKEIAATLENSVTTVITHVKNTMKKIGVNNRTEIAIWALNKSIV